MVNRLSYICKQEKLHKKLQTTKKKKLNFFLDKL